MIQMYHVHMSYSSDAPVLVDITMRIGKAEFAFVTGPSGAGKTSLLRLIMLSEACESGQLLLFGQNVARIKARHIYKVRRRIGMVFQDFKLLPLSTVGENVAVALEVMGRSRREVRKRVRSVLRLVGLEHKINSTPPRLSGGEQQRVAIARAMVSDPPILLADEPTGNLDAELSIEIDGLLSDIAARGTTVLVATHDMAWVDRTQRRVIRLERGRVVAGGLPE
ncbi:MAG: cell division ATP-binding protein FtsE [Deltaproteobacteria bacterium]|nr:cell division ATP-binding protein FtsE [Deltaproteobacteria bacterium]